MFLQRRASTSAAVSVQPRCRAAPARRWLAPASRCKKAFRASSAGPAPLETRNSSDWKGCEHGLAKPIKVVGMGGCAVDYLASVAAYPKPDQKLRSETLEVQGGGNCGNALTAAARLGLSPTIITKIGGDGLGDGILSELKGDGVDTSYVIRAAGCPSPFTYIIVDRAGGTRTCIHTPGAPLRLEEMSDAAATPAGRPILDTALEGALLVYFDGRLTDAAILLAQRARAQGVPVLVEAERLRPDLEQLLELADYVCTSAHFPQEWTGEKELADALLATALRLPRARLITTTLGARGSVLLELEEGEGSGGEPGRTLLEVMQELDAELGEAGREGQEAVACVSRTGVEIRAGRVAASPRALQLRFSSQRDPEAAARQSRDAAAREARCNADAANAERYAASAGSGTATATGAPLRAKVYRAAAAGLPKEAVVDTTGAGDSFIGSVLYGMSTGMSRTHMLRLASVVAAAKCTELGARPGLPRRRDLSEPLLS